MSVRSDDPTARPAAFRRNLLPTLLPLAAALCSCLAPLSLVAQQQPDPAVHRLQGVVHDPLGDVVAGASVELIEGTRVVATTATGTDGTFRFDLRKAGRYSFHVSAATFQPASIPAAYFKGTEADVDITLATQTLTQQITITATGTPTPEAQTGAAVTVLPATDFRFMPEVQEPLRLVPGVQITQVGQMGGTSGLSIRGGATDANKVLLDGVPLNAIGGGVEFANLASAGISSIEVLREPNSALYGSDALAGVVSLTTARNDTPLPLFSYAGDAGNFHTYRNEVTAGAVFRQFDLYSAFARIDTQNNIPNSAFHNATYAGNFGWTPDRATELRFTVRHLAVSGGQPNAIALYGIADDGQQKEQDDYYDAFWNNRTTDKWHNLIRYGGVRQNGLFTEFGATGIPDSLSPGFYDGAPVTISGANGYKVSGQAIFQYSDSLSKSASTTNRDFVYAQTDYQINPHLLALGAFKFEHESGTSLSTGYPVAAIERGNYSYSLQFSGDLRNRLFYHLGTGLEDNGLFGFAATPRVSLAYYLVRPSSQGALTGTKLHGSFGKGIKEPSVYQQTNSLYGVLQAQMNGNQLIAQYGVSPLGAENSRTFDAGVDQEALSGRARFGLTYFHDEFTNGVEYVPPAGLVDLGVADATALAGQYIGAYLNSSAFRSQGIEVESEYRINNQIFARAGYTYTDAVVQRSFSSDNLGPSYNTTSTFANIPIGAYSPLVGARPFRIAPHTGYFAIDYQRRKLNATLTGTLVGRRDDSDFLCDNTVSYGCGPSLLLPNRNLDASYQRLALGGGYQITPRVEMYTNIENLLSQHYFEAFGYPALPFTFRSGVKLNFGGESWKLK